MLLISSSPATDKGIQTGSSAIARQIDAHPYRYEEQPEEQSVERLDIDRDLVAVFSLGKEEAGEECAQRQ